MLNVALSFCIVFTIGEISLLLKRRAKKTGAISDGNTLSAFWIVLPISIYLAFQTLKLPPSENFHLPSSLLPSGALLASLGLILRWYSIHRLGQWFTVDVALSPGQVLMRKGPYRFVRNPSYTGALMTLAGIGILLGNAPALFLMTIPPLLMFLHRIRVEERVLSKGFGSQWVDYRSQTWRLVPCVY
ncbi:isoprenylcysteine carboxylmethyltransferase family protein [Gluconobacter cerinus]|uniref:methyltransferase family protein n=1 Tax=Gluconobacter cerinus TaxID=38307 RepID=UPI001B8D9884|nr:isoprenylcysteine carboxylmethyltransferase family protein [Gluconobacter cerinus]MBS1072841.1 isoprenylcysteine carboxylmethyltransferase family protein [Gluconobacter cerinus]